MGELFYLPEDRTSPAAMLCPCNGPMPCLTGWNTYCALQEQCVGDGRVWTRVFIIRSRKTNPSAGQENRFLLHILVTDRPGSQNWVPGPSASPQFQCNDWGVEKSSLCQQGIGEQPRSCVLGLHEAKCKEEARLWDAVASTAAAVGPRAGWIKMETVWEGLGGLVG